MKDHIYQTSYKVRIADADKNGQLKCNSLLQMMQEAATEHATILEVDFKNLKPLNLGWAISKFIININRLPSWGERISVATWASIREKISTAREFIVTDSFGSPIITARSQWILFDTNTRKLARMEKIRDWPRMEDRLASNDSFDEPLIKPSETSSACTICSARGDDIDLNGHVNNSIFLIWAMESLPQDFAKSPRRIRINFLEEVMPHSHVSTLCQLDADATLHSVLNPENGRECARINLEWRA